MAGGNSTKDQDTQPIVEIPQDGFSLETPLKKRKWRKALPVMFLLTAAGIIYYGVKEKTVFDYQAYNNCTIITLGWIKKVTTCYTRKDDVTYPVFFNLGFGLLGIILGTFIDRFALFLEELFQVNIRYNGSTYKVFKVYFSGVNWPGVIIVCVAVIIGCSLGRKTPFTLADIMYIVGGIGVGPLVIHMLNLNTQSEVDVSRILEEREMYPGYTLAWSYYFNHLKPLVKEFQDAIMNRRPSPSSSATRENEIKLSLDKLLLLLPPGTDLTDIDRLTSYDETIRKFSKGHDRNPCYPFPVYQLQEREDRYYAMECVKEPIVALREMKSSANVKFVTVDTYEDEIKRFYTALCKILENPPDDECAMMGLIVPITIKTGEKEKLRHGGLSNIIMRKVKQQGPVAAGIRSSNMHTQTSQNVQEGSEQDRLLPSGDESDALDYGASTSLTRVPARSEL